MVNTQSVEQLDEFLILRFQSKDSDHVERSIAISDFVQMMQIGASGSILRRICSSVPKAIVIKTVGSDNTNFSKLFRRKLSKQQTDNVYNLSSLWMALNDFFDNDSDMISDWLHTNIPALEGNKPEQLIDTSFGRQQVKLCLEAMKYGDFA
jgi:putative toxin-antitoxin system antitoxin component (TIGR02293 family)